MKRYFLVFVFLVVLSVPLITFGAGVVPCNGPDCQACDLAKLGQNIMNWFIATSVPLAALLFAWGGFKMVSSRGNEHDASSGKAYMTNALVGIIIILGAWLLVDTLLKNVLVNGALFGTWNKIECTAPLPPLPASPAPTPGTTSGGAGCPTCTQMSNSIPTNGNACSGTCIMRPDMSERLTGVGLTDSGLVLSEGFPPTVTHRESCHTSATCVDVSFRDRTTNPSATQIQSAIGEMRAQNLTPVYEVPTQARANELRSAGVNALVVPGINREHFSVYMCDKDSSPSACKSI